MTIETEQTAHVEQALWQYGSLFKMNGQSCKVMSFNPAAWSRRFPLTELIDDIMNRAEPNYRIRIRFYGAGNDLIADMEFDDRAAAIKKCKAAKSGMERQSKCDTWDPLNITGPQGHLTNFAEFVPGVGTLLGKGHRLLGKEKAAQQAEKRKETRDKVTSYIPIAGHAQAVVAHCRGDDELCAKSMTRATGTSAAVAVGLLAAPAAVGAAAVGAGHAAAVGCATGATSCAAKLGAKHYTEMAFAPAYREQSKRSLGDNLKDVGVAGVLGGVTAGLGGYFSSGAADAAEEASASYVKDACSGYGQSVVDGMVNEARDECSEIKNVMDMGDSIKKVVSWK